MVVSLRSGRQPWLHYGTKWWYNLWGQVSPPARFLLSQLVICAHSGSRYEGCIVQSTRSKPKSRRAYEYLCGGLNRGKRKCKKGAIPQNKFEAVVIKEVVNFYKQYRGNKGHERCLQAIRRRVELEEKAVDAIKCELQIELRELDNNPLNLSQDYDSTSQNIKSQNSYAHNRKRLLLERRLNSLDYIALSEEEIPELLDQLQAFVGKLHNIMRSTNQEERLASFDDASPVSQSTPRTAKLRSSCVRYQQSSPFSMSDQPSK